MNLKDYIKRKGVRYLIVSTFPPLLRSVNIRILSRQSLYYCGVTTEFYSKIAVFKSNLQTQGDGYEPE